MTARLAPKREGKPAQTQLRGQPEANQRPTKDQPEANRTLHFPSAPVQVLRCLHYLPTLRFHYPLISPNSTSLLHFHPRLTSCFTFTLLPFIHIHHALPADPFPIQNHSLICSRPAPHFPRRRRVPYVRVALSYPAPPLPHRYPQSNLAQLISPATINSIRVVV